MAEFDTTWVPLLPADQMRQLAGSIVKANVTRILTNTLNDEPVHAEVVAGGEFHFRLLFGKHLGPFYQHSRANCDDLADVVFRKCRVSWSERHPGVSPEMFLDAYCPISPPTDLEIEAAWVREIGSSEDAMRTMYDGSARTRTGADAFGHARDEG